MFPRSRLAAFTALFSECPVCGPSFSFAEALLTQAVLPPCSFCYLLAFFTLSCSYVSPMPYRAWTLGPHPSLQPWLLEQDLARGGPSWIRNELIHFSPVTVGDLDLLLKGEERMTQKK